MIKNILYLGSQSPARQQLLTEAQIPYTVLKHDSSEDLADPSLPFNEYVLAIAQHKMEHLLFPDPKTIQYNETGIFVLTADTLVRIPGTKEILGKPIDKNDAIRMLKQDRKAPVELVTGCCLERKTYDNGWITLEQAHWTTPALVEFDVPDDDIEGYFKNIPEALNVCGAGYVEKFGVNFLKKVTGSYSTIIGLPMYELRKELKKMNFF